MQQQSNFRQPVGKAILLGMLLASFLSVFAVMWKIETALPQEFTLFWLAISTLAILFPVMASHLYVLWLSKCIRWISFWFWIANAMIGGLWIYAKSRNEYSDFEVLDITPGEVATWFFSCVVGGTLGGSIVFGSLRRFTNWLGYQKPETKPIKHNLSLRTLFFWVTSVGIICGALVNSESFLLLTTSHEMPLIVWVLLGALNVGLFCLLVFPFVMYWLRTATPFWLAGLALMVFGFLVPTVVAAFATIAATSYGGEPTRLALAYASLFTCASFYASVWILSCRWAGLMPLKTPAVERTGFRRIMATGCRSVGWGLKQVCFAVTALTFVYGGGWCLVHFNRGPQRDHQLIQASITKSVGGKVGEDWIDVINRQWGEGVSKENNLAVQILQVSNPFDEAMTAEEAEHNKMRLPLSNKFHPGITSYRSKIGFSKEEFKALPSISLEDWLYERYEPYRRQMLEEYYGNDLDSTSLGSPDENPVNLADPSLEQVPPEIFFDRISIEKTDLLRTPWNEKDYPFGAEFIRAHRPQIVRLRELSKSTTFYSPLVRETGGRVSQLSGQLLETPRYLLEASALYHTGSDEIEEAIEDCEALLRLTGLPVSEQDAGPMTYMRLRHQTRANDLVASIAFSEFTSVEQMKRLLKLHRSQPYLLRELAPDRPLYSAIIKDDIFQFLRSPIFDFYKLHPWLVDWSVFDSKFDQLYASSIGTVELALNGELSYGEFSTRIDDVWTSALPGGQRTGKDVYYSVFGRQVLAFVNGPAAKGNILAEIFAGVTLQQFAVFQGQANRSLQETAIAVEIFKRVNGRYPDSLKQLVPDFLSSLHLDPYSGKDFAYRTNENDFVLYSVHRNLVDDGGFNYADLMFEPPIQDLVD